MFDMSPPIAVVAHDAGAANQIIALLKERARLDDLRVYMDGPAKRLWHCAFPEKECFATLDEALDGSSSLIAGSGWASDLEYSAISIAKSMGLHSAAVLDHWANYQARFDRHGKTALPDEFWVMDSYARDIATSVFPGERVRLFNDYYLDGQVQRIGDEAEKNRLLYLLEPARDDWGRGVPGEFQSLDYLIERLPLLGLPENLLLVLRPHPSEEESKYYEWADINRAQGYQIEFDNSAELAGAISKAQWVAGCESYALVVALASGRTVFCSLPPWGPTCRLPHEGLIQIKNL